MEGTGDVNGEPSTVIHRAIPEIRIRKGSDAPSIGEIKGTAPLASIESEGLSEGTSDIDDIDTQTLKDNTDLFTDTKDNAVFFTEQGGFHVDIVHNNADLCETNVSPTELNNGYCVNSETGNDTDNFSVDNITIMEKDDRYDGEKYEEEDGEITPCASPPHPILKSEDEKIQEF